MTHKDMFQNNFQNELLRNEIRRKMFNWAMASEEFGYDSLTKEECLVATHPSSGQKRISLSEKIINNAKEVIFHVTGAGKKYVIDEIINNRGNYKSYPASYINPESANLSWYLDFEASEMLTK